MVKQLVNRVLAPSGLMLVPRKAHDELLSRAQADIRGDARFMEIYERCRPYTMTCMERMYGLYQAVSFVIAQDIPGDFVECGVWRGGSSMVIALTLKKLGVTDRGLHLYDTFNGMSPPTVDDVDLAGRSVEEDLRRRGLTDVGDLCNAPLDDVKTNMESTGYPSDRVRYIEGDVLKTIPQQMPEGVALLRLDTDWYESTYHELTHLYPLLARHGVLVIDDYGHWQGARKAVDQYFDENDVRMMMPRLDYSCRIGVKI